MATPQEIAQNYIEIGKKKAALPISKMFLLGIMAGVFIGFGGVASTTASVSITSPSVAKFISAVVFPGGLAMVLLAGAELFTGNNLLVIPMLKKEISFGAMLKNWVVVYLGNLVGGILVAALCVYGHEASLFSNGVAVSMISTAAAKTALPFSEAILKGIGCNFLVCIAVWISFAASDVSGKILGIFFPVMFFVLCGFEHCVANMYYISAGIFAMGNPAYLSAAVEAGVDVSALTLGNMFLKNLLPVTIGNIIGGAVCVGAVYYFVYLREEKN